MKRILLLVLLSANLCTAQTTTTIIDFNNGARGDAEAPCPPNAGCFFGTGWRSVSNIRIKATHGCPDINYGLVMTSFVSVETGDPLGSGILVEYNFKSNYKYRISTAATLDLSYLQLQMTNSATFASNLCTFRTNAVDIISATNPSTTFMSDHASIEIIPTQCYSYLWFSAVPMPNTAGGSVSLQNITIEEIADYSISGPDDVCSSANYLIKLFDQTYSGSVSWSVQNLVGSPVSTNVSGNHMTLTKVSDGIIKLTANITKPCSGGNTIIEKYIVIGTPQPQYLTTNYTYCYPEIAEAWYQEINVSPAMPHLQYEWSENGGPFNTSNSSGYSFYGFYPATSVISVRYKNTCGAGSAITGYYSHPCLGGLFKVNQRGNELVLENQRPMEIRQVEIYDINGIKRSEIKVPGTSKGLNVNIQNIPKGINILRIYDGKTWYTRKFIKL